ncbi:26-29-p [Cordylochernes scorpioides]|uniref:26-29-p n=1 Tax=Cordylochernes scorpioides TaxID=51811 RepID=A0ABY6KHH8_9ARAC|nr:26-29-p [Cordylochernes scorpioides]
MCGQLQGEEPCPNEYFSHEWDTCEVWRQVTTEGSKENRYTLWISRDGSGNAVPIQYEMMGYDSLLGSHYDKYMVAYGLYSTDPFSDDVFTINENEEAARKYPEKLAKIIKDGGYCAHQIFNADETGLFWKKMPTRTYIAKSEKNASGFKAAKDRVTLLLFSNASGDRMLKPLLVNRSLKPRALKGKDLNTLPVHWMANKKAWVTTAIFTEWFNKCFVPEVENYMKEMCLEFKILLILDNAPDHVALAIAEIKSQTLNACWKAAWPECVSKRNESNRTTIVTSDIISIAKEIGGEGFDDFGEHDIEELLVDEALNDDDILESMVDTTKDFETVDSELEDVTPLDEKLLREGLQLSGKLEIFFIQNDNDVERALKFQRDLKFCMSGYRELYKELVKPSQRLITDYLVKEKKITEVPKEALPCRSDDVILSSSDESDLAPIHKRQSLKTGAAIACRGFPGPGLRYAVHEMNPIKEFIEGHDDHNQKAYVNFKNSFSKIYPAHRENLHREHIFRQNFRYIHSKNRANLGFQLAVNHLADRSDQERMYLRGRLASPGYNGGAAFHKENYNVDDLPDSMDWRLYGAVTPVKDQAICGSCWSFGTTGTLEGAYFLKHKILKKFSPQQLVDCSWTDQNNGCDGGEDFRAYQYIKRNGLATEEDYGPYLGVVSGGATTHTLSFV